MKTYTHSCIKCLKQYSDNEIDAYYCNECNNARLQIAREIDKKVGSTVGQKPTGISALEADMKLKGGFSETTQDGINNSRLFINVRDIGLL